MGYQDAERLLVDFYEVVLPGEHVGTFVPSPRPEFFVRVWRTGGAAVNRILDAPILTTQVWGSATAETPDLVDTANRLRDALYGRLDLVPPARGVEEVSGLYWDPDPDSGAPRYTFASRVLIRARA